MRLFVALALPDHLRSRLAELCSGLPGARWVAPENLHLTLRFIGEVDGRDAEDIGVALSGIRLPRFAIALSGVGEFGDGRRLRSVWVGVEASDMLNRLHAKVEQAVQRAGQRSEEHTSELQSLMRISDAVFCLKKKKKKTKRHTNENL